MEAENELPILAGIAAMLRWAEELLNIINGPLLLFGAGVALVDLLTDGALTVSLPILLYGWAVSQALGIDTQLLGCFARARNVKGWARWGWLALGLILGYAAWQAGYVFAVQQAQHISEVAALAQLHMDPALWLGWRAFLAVGLVALSGWTRYKKPAPVAISVDAERQKLQEQLELEPLRQRLNAQRVGGWRGLAETALHGAGAAQSAPIVDIVHNSAPPAQPALTASQDGAETASPAQPDTEHGPDKPPSPPTGPGTPVVAKPKRAPRPEVIRLVPDTPPKPRKRIAAEASAKRVRTPGASVEQLARAAWLPGMTVTDLQAAAKISRNAAMSWRRTLMAEAAGVRTGDLAQ